MLIDEKYQAKRENAIEAYMSEFSAVRHEGVKGCEFAGISGVTYAEISKDAFIKYYQDSRLELKDVEFLSPLAIKIDTPQEIRTIIKKESDYLKFIISSRAEQKGTKESIAWKKHAEGSMYKLAEEESPQFTLKELKERCRNDKKTIRINAVTGVFGFGRVWDCSAHTCTGDGEALIEFNAPDEAVEALKGYVLHSCLIDCIIDTAIRHLAGNGWEASSYESLKLYGSISGKTYAYIRKADKKARIVNTAGFHITLLDEAGNRILEIRNYTIRYGELGSSIEGNSETTESSTEKLEGNIEKMENSTEKTEGNIEKRESSTEKTEGNIGKMESSAEKTEGYQEKIKGSNNGIVDKAEGCKLQKDIGYSTAKHGRPVEDISQQNNTSLFLSGLSWRQMNCRDRIIAFLLGYKKASFVNYFKFFLGANRGYNLTGIEVTEAEITKAELANTELTQIEVTEANLTETDLTKPDDWVEEIFHNRILNRFGYTITTTRVENPKEVHEKISKLIDEGKPVGIWMDEYHIFYTPFYLKSHTGHIAVINGYNRENRLYSIIDHNHLRINNPSQFIDYGQFYCTYDVLENIYSDMGSEHQFILTLEELPKGHIPETDELQRQVIRILRELVEHEQADRDIQTIISNKRGSFDTDSVDALYLQLGGKELMLDTAINYFCQEPEGISHRKELSNKIIQNSNILVNSYITGLYRGKGIPSEKAEDYIQRIQKDSATLFQELWKQCEEKNG